MERHAGRAGNRGLVNAKRLVRRQEQQRRVNDIAQDMVVSRARADQDGGHEKGAQQGGGQVKWQSTVEGMTRGQNRVGDMGHGMEWHAMSCQGRAGRVNIST